MILLHRTKMAKEGSRGKPGFVGVAWEQSGKVWEIGWHKNTFII